MAKREPGLTLPVVTVRGTHADLGRAMGEARAAQITRMAATALEALREQGTSEAELHEQVAPYVDAAGRVYPQLLVELQEMARAADVPFDVLFRLNCYESRPPGTPARPPAATLAITAKDPGVLPLANDPAAVPAAPNDGCTSVASRSERGVVVGHTEDSSPDAVEGLYLLDATVGAGPRFMCLNYAQTLPGCAAGVNEHGLVILIDALPDPDRRIGAPRHFVSRALLDLPTIDDVIDHLRHTERGGGWNYLVVQDRRIVNVEATATRLVTQEANPEGTLAHSNHYVDPTLAADAGDPRPNSVSRLARAMELVTTGMDVAQMKRLLSDRQGEPDSICRERTIGAFIADTAARRVSVCWGEPDEALWTTQPF
ncbi:MAG: C45 family peptidase [Chloroflexota bacterium]|nr:C45 family peptidase [Chloroflexota bacterium]